MHADTKNSGAWISLVTKISEHAETRLYKLFYTLTDHREILNDLEGMMSVRKSVRDKTALIIWLRKMRHADWLIMEKLILPTQQIKSSCPLVKTS